MPVDYKEVRLDCGYRIDVLVDDRLTLELKAVEEYNGIHKAQRMTYMKLSEIGTGLLIKFNVSAWQTASFFIKLLTLSCIRRCCPDVLFAQIRVIRG